MSRPLGDPVTGQAVRAVGAVCGVVSASIEGRAAAAEDLTVAVGIDADRDQGMDVDDPAALTDLLGQRVDPHKSVVLKDQPVAVSTSVRHAHIRDHSTLTGSYPYTTSPDATQDCGGCGG